MKVVFEAQLFLKGNKTGIAWCADNLIRELAKDRQIEWQCDYFMLGYGQEEEDKVRAYEKCGVKMQACWWFHNVLYKLLWSVFPIPYHLFFRDKRDITQFFNFIIPPGVKGKTVTIVHDMAYLSHSNTVADRTRRWLLWNMEKSCKRADKIVTVSEFSKKEIIKYLNIKEEKIVVMPNGVDGDFFYPRQKEEIEQIKDRFQIKREYFLYLGTLEPRKNIERLLEAYARLKEEREENIPFLVLAGQKGWLYDSIFQLVEKLRLKEQVLFTGYIKQEDVPALLSGATAFIFPSLYEGFGMPPLEAMACGTAVITSNTSSLPEVIGEAGILINPYSVEEIKEAMKKVWKEKDFADRLRKAGRERAKEYTWERSARVLKEVYLELRRDLKE